MTNKTESKKELPEVNLVYKEPLLNHFHSVPQELAIAQLTSRDTNLMWNDLSLVHITSSPVEYADLPGRRFCIPLKFSDWLLTKKITDKGAIFYYYGHTCIVLKAFICERANTIYIRVIFYMIEKRYIESLTITDLNYLSTTHIQSYFK